MITNLDTSMNGSIRATLSTGDVLHDITNVVCHSISTNRPDPIWLQKDKRNCIKQNNGKHCVL